MDLVVISLLAYFMLKDLNLDIYFYIIYISSGWLFTAYFLKFYEIYRFTIAIRIISKIIKQGVVFLLIVIAFFPFSNQAIFRAERIGQFKAFGLLLITVSKFFLFFSNIPINSW
jgi:putative colanic acid biosynthesis UDP-glucose lipid carrier transferase